MLVVGFEPYNELLKSLKLNRNETLVLLACYARNKEKMGCCSDAVIGYKTGLSPDTIQKCFKTLIENKKFKQENIFKRERYGSITDHDFIEFSKKYFIEHNIHQQVFIGYIQDNNQDENIVHLKCLNGQNYILHCSDSWSPIFFLKKGTFLKFNGCFLENINNTPHITIHESTLKCFPTEQELQEMVL